MKKHLTLPIQLNIVFISKSTSTDPALFKRWFQGIDDTVRHRSKQPIATAGETTTTLHYNYTFHALHTTPETAETLQEYISAVARPNTDDGTTPPSLSNRAYVVDADALDLKLLEMWQALTQSNTLPQGYTLFVLDVPSQSTPPTSFTYRRGWSALELKRLSLNPDVQNAVEEASQRVEGDTFLENGMGDDEEDLFETDVIPADMPPTKQQQQQQQEQPEQQQPPPPPPPPTNNKEVHHQQMKVWSHRTRQQITLLKAQQATSKATASATSALQVLRGKRSLRQQTLLLHLQEHLRKRRVKYATFQDRSHSLPVHVPSSVRNRDTCQVEAWLNAHERFGWIDLSVLASTVERGTIGSFHQGSGRVRSFSSTKEQWHEENRGKELTQWSKIRRLTPIVSSFMRHVVTPPTTLHTTRTIKEAKRMRRVERVSFHIHLVDVVNQWNDGSGEEVNSMAGENNNNNNNNNNNKKNTRSTRKRKTNDNKDSTRTVQFDLRSFKRQVAALRAHDQEFSFTFQRVSLNDDSALASAYYSSMRFAVEPTLHVAPASAPTLAPASAPTLAPTSTTDQQQKKEKEHTLQKQYTTDSKRVVYLDAKHLFNQLSTLQTIDPQLRDATVNTVADSSSSGDSGNKDQAGKENTLSFKNVPVFIFAHAVSDQPDVGTPVLLERTKKIASSVNGMVFVVEHGQGVFGPRILWESPTVCGTTSMYEDLGNPIRPALRAIANALGGLLPLHVGPSALLANAGQDHVQIVERHNDWQWSVGTSPLALTATDPKTTTFSRFNIDALHRSTIAQAMIASKMLLQPSYEISQTVASLHSVENFRMVALREQSMLNMNAIAKQVQKFEYDTALRSLKMLLQTSRSVHDISTQLKATEDAHKCIQQGSNTPWFSGISWTTTVERMTQIHMVEKPWIIGIEALVLVFFLLFCLKRTGRSMKKKAKIN